jgi:diacylglycerol kinase family enzyme
LPIVVNIAGGAASRTGEGLAGELETAFAEAGRSIDLELVDGSELDAALARHVDAERVVVGGGDGTIAAAARAVSRRGGELAILPLGTRNHVARQLGLPLDLAGAAKLAASGIARRVDLGEAGDRVFVNNASAGAYVELVQRREVSRLPKLLATVPAAWRTLRQLRSRCFTLALDGHEETIVTPLLFIGNNRYEVSSGHPGERRVLDDGLLSCYAVAPLSSLGLVIVALRTLAGHPRMHRDFVLDRLAHEVRIDGADRALEVALDGELTRCDLPLTIRIRPGALAVVAPEND